MFCQFPLYVLYCCRIPCEKSVINVQEYKASAIIIEVTIYARFIGAGFKADGLEDLIRVIIKSSAALFCPVLVQAFLQEGNFSRAWKPIRDYDQHDVFDRRMKVSIG